MKYKIVLLFFLISIKVSCQFDNLGKYYSENLNDKKNEDKSFSIYKIKGNIYTSDHKKYFSLENKKIFENKTEDIIYFVLYKKRFLFVGYYPKTREQQMSSIGYELRSLRRLDIVDLEDSSKKWVYEFDKKTTIKNIKKFNPKDGDIEYCNHIKPEKKGSN